jgi:FkbM family methyltransferase
MIIGYRLADNIYFERNGEERILNFLLKDANHIIDVGANEGNYIAKILESSSKGNPRIDAFEPSNISFQVLTQKYHGARNIFLNNFALGDEKMEVSFFEDLAHSETSSLISENTSSDRKREIKINIDTLDNIYGDDASLIDFLKIDAEGYDFKILQGAKDLLKDNRIRFIQFEYNDSWRFSGSTLIACIKYLQSFGYTTLLIQSNGLYEYNYNKFGEFFRYSNFFAFRAKDLAFIQPLIRGII